MSRQRRRELVEFCTKWQLPIIEDDAYGPLYLGQDQPPSLKSFDQNGVVIYTGTASKSLAAGLRLGWVVAPESVVQQRELEDELWRQMQKLSAEQRAALVARYYLQMSESEMAGLAQVPAGTIKWRLSKARARLRQLFGDDPRKDLK